MTLGQKQRKFTRMVADLIIWSYDNGYELTFAEAYRTPEQAKINASKGTGVTASLHIQRLAIDLNLFRDGVFLQNSTDHLALGKYWESLGGTWGGRFKKPDGNHYSLEHEGVK